MERKLEEIPAIYVKWWERALKEFLNWPDSQIDEWVEWEKRSFMESEDYCRSEAVRLVARLMMPSDETLHEYDIRVFDMEGVIQGEIKHGMHSFGIEGLDPSTYHWDRTRRKLNYALAMVGESLPDPAENE